MCNWIFCLNLYFGLVKYIKGFFVSSEVNCDEKMVLVFLLINSLERFFLSSFCVLLKLSKCVVEGLVEIM